MAIVFATVELEIRSGEVATPVVCSLLVGVLYVSNRHVDGCWNVPVGSADRVRLSSVASA